MSSPYTQDIDVSVKAMQKRNEPSLSEKLVSLYTNYVQKENEIANENIKNLATDFIPEKQQLNLQIKNYNEILKIQDDINKNYGGDVNAYARNKVTQDYNKQAAASFGLRGVDGAEIVQDNTATTSKDFLNARTENYAKKLNEVFTTAGKINLPKEYDATYVDKMFSNEINRLPTLEKQNGFKLLANVITGQGLNISSDYGTAKDDILKRVYSDIPNKELGELGDQFKELYTIDPRLAQQFETEIKDNIVVGTNVKTQTNFIDKEINGIKIRVAEAVTTYKSKNGEIVILPAVIKRISEDEIVPDFENVKTIIQSLSDAGQKRYVELQGEGKKYHEIVRDIANNPDNFKDSSAEAIFNAYMSPQAFETMQDAYNSWRVQNGFATAEVDPISRKLLVVPVEGAETQKGYQTFEEYRLELANNASGKAGRATPVTGNSEPIVNASGDAEAFNLSPASFKAPLFQLSMQGKNENLTSAKTGEVISLPVYAEESLGLDNSQLAEDLAEEFKDKDFSRVSPAGIWFNKNNPVILDVVEAQAVLGNEINETIELGWNVKDETFAFRTIRQKFAQEQGVIDYGKIEKNNKVIARLEQQLEQGYIVRPLTARGNENDPMNQIQLSGQQIDNISKSIERLEEENQTLLETSTPVGYKSFEKIQNRLEELNARKNRFETSRYEMNDIEYEREVNFVESEIVKNQKEMDSLLARDVEPTEYGDGPMNKLTMAESSNNPNALWKQSHRKRFADFVATESTMDEVLNFVRLDGSYANWSKTQSKGKNIHTPVGKYQFVGATLRDIKDRGGFEEIGITGDTLFSPEVQDKLFVWYMTDTIRAAGENASQTEVRNKVRSRWEGATKENISDRELDKIIQEVQQGTYI
jgi:hypothetical protein|tara:strand:- start:4211 stop:6826 length:2616 start_codon:yes stop_codon:yes gene_type:complete